MAAECPSGAAAVQASDGRAATRSAARCRRGGSPGGRSRRRCAAPAARAMAKPSVLCAACTASAKRHVLLHDLRQVDEAEIGRLALEREAPGVGGDEAEDRLRDQRGVEQPVVHGGRAPHRERDAVRQGRRRVGQAPGEARHGDEEDGQPRRFVDGVEGHLVAVLDVLDDEAHRQRHRHQPDRDPVEPLGHGVVGLRRHPSALPDSRPSIAQPPPPLLDGMLAVHADWSLDPRKRWMTAARLSGGAWRAEAPAPVGEVAALLPGLLAAGAPVALGLDLPLGLPRDYARHLAEPDFPAFLRGLGGAAGLLRGERGPGDGGARPPVLSGARRARHDAGGARGGARDGRAARPVALVRPRDGGAPGRGAAVLDARRQPVGQGGDRGVAGLAAAGARRGPARRVLALRGRAARAAGAGPGGAGGGLPGGGAAAVRAPARRQQAGAGAAARAWPAAFRAAMEARRVLPSPALAAAVADGFGIRSRRARTGSTRRSACSG